MSGKYILRRTGERHFEFVDQDTREVRMSVTIPEDGMTTEEVERFRVHLLKLTSEKPS